MCLFSEPGKKVTVKSFVATSNTSMFVRWSALEEIHHNAETETIFYMIVLTNTNTSEAQSVNTSTLTMNIQGIHIAGANSGVVHWVCSNPPF